MSIMVNTLVAFSPFLLQRQAGFPRPKLHRRRCASRIQYAPNDLSAQPRNQRVYPSAAVVLRLRFLEPAFPPRR